MIISSYTAQLCLDDNKAPVCAMLVLDGLVKTAPEKDQVITVALSHDNQLTIEYGGESISLQQLHADICAPLRNGMPLLIKHEGSSYESLVPVTL